jgi:hypothetical protein
MKKIVLVAVLFVEMVTVTFAQTMSDGVLLNTRTYADIFGFRNGEVHPNNDYVLAASRAERREFSVLDGSETVLDTPLEFALLSYYSSAVVQIRPAEANAILPANNPKLADLKLGAALYQDIQVLRFLADTNAAGRYEGMLKFITDRGNVTRAEVEAFYRDNVRGLIAGVVDEEFNKISFLVENYSTNSRFSYDAVLMRNPQTGQYTLSYERASVENDDKTLTAASLDALLSVMRNSGDFVPAAIDTVRAQAALIPAVVYADWKQKGVAGGVDALALITETLTNFYLNPGQQTYEVILGIYARYRVLIGAKDVFADEALSAYRSRTIYALSPELGKKVVDDMQLVNIMETAKIPTDRRYDVFSTPYR